MNQEVLRKRNIETLYLGTIGDDSAGSPKSWNIKLVAYNKELPFKLDTGAKVTAITKRSYQSIGSPHLQKCEQQLRGPNKHLLDVIGILNIT